jgi:hypothetical protein
MPETLLNHGLVKLGAWLKGKYATVEHLRGDCPFGIAYDLPKVWHTKKNVIYAFVFGGSVRYVGETTSGMASRFSGYRYGNPLKNDTDNRVKLAITRALMDEYPVEIWGSQPISHIYLPNGLELEIPASKSLEDHLIFLLNPELNIKAKGQANSSIRN